MDDDEDDVGGEEGDASFTTDVQGSPSVATSSLFSPAASTVCSSEVAGMVGMKNLPPTTDFTGGAEGDWKEFVKAPPPLLNVSTYLDRTPILPRAEN